MPQSSQGPQIDEGGETHIRRGDRHPWTLVPMKSATDRLRWNSWEGKVVPAGRGDA